MRNIVVTAGHSIADPGATNGVLTEADICTDFRNLVSHYLKRDGVKHITDGAAGENFPLGMAVKLITPGSVAVEFHCNAFHVTSASGVETLSHDSRKSLGAKLCKAVSGLLTIPDRGAKAEGAGQHSRLAFVSAGGIILELFFLSNPSDLRNYLDRKWLVARIVAEILKEEASK